MRSTGFSAWPPGARCSYGEPERTDIVVNGWFAAVVVAMGFMFAVVRPTFVAARDLGRRVTIRLRAFDDQPALALIP